MFILHNSIFISYYSFLTLEITPPFFFFTSSFFPFGLAPFRLFDCPVFRLSFVYIDFLLDGPGFWWCCWCDWICSREYSTEFQSIQQTGVVNGPSPFLWLFRGGLGLWIDGRKELKCDGWTCWIGWIGRGGGQWREGGRGGGGCCILAGKKAGESNREVLCNDNFFPILVI